MGYAAEHGIKLLAFDIDGTLYPKAAMNRRLVVSSLLHLPFALKYNSMRRQIRNETGFSVPPEDNLEAFQIRQAEILGKSLDWFQKKEDAVFRKPWDKLFSSIKPYPGLREVLEEAKEDGYMLAALSDFPLFHKLEALGVDDLFDYSASCEDYGALKPSAAPFLRMLKELQISPAEALYTGDSRSKDIDGAKNAGMHTALISRSVRAYDNADIIFRDWKEFGKMVL